MGEANAPCGLDRVSICPGCNAQGVIKVQHGFRVMDQARILASFLLGLFLSAFSRDSGVSIGVRRLWRRRLSR